MPEIYYYYSNNVTYQYRNDIRTPSVIVDGCEKNVSRFVNRTNATVRRKQSIEYRAYSYGLTNS